MLMDGGIIDYGSIRQFGLCHHRYRYDDVDRYSTNLKEQKAKARYLVQTFVQLVDFVRSGEKRDLKNFAESSHLRTFDRAYERTLHDSLLRRVGLNQRQRKAILRRRPKLVREFVGAYRFFERKESRRGMRNTADGVNNPVIFCTRTLLRELPKRLLLGEKELVVPDFLEIMRTPYATKKELRQTEYYSPRVKKFQRLYLQILRAAGGERSLRRTLVECTMRSGQENRGSFATGDAILIVVDHLLAKRRKLSRGDFLALVDAFIAHQKGENTRTKLRPDARRVLAQLVNIVEQNKFSI
jgi:hypothetical protein